MSKNDKVVAKFLSNPKDFTWEELVKLLNIYGYEEEKTGKTGGSRTSFFNKEGKKIKTHKPHKPNIVKSYVIREIKEKLNIEG